MSIVHRDFHLGKLTLFFFEHHSLVHSLFGAKAIFVFLAWVFSQQEFFLNYSKSFDKNISYRKNEKCVIRDIPSDQFQSQFRKHDNNNTTLGRKKIASPHETKGKKQILSKKQNNPQQKKKVIYSLHCLLNCEKKIFVKILRKKPKKVGNTKDLWKNK